MTSAAPASCFSPAWPDAPRLRRRIAAAGRLFLFLDFDGTLAPLVDDPSQVVLPEHFRPVLCDLAVKHRVATVLVSGRELDDLDPRVGSRLALVRAGNYGLEIRGGGLDYTEPQALESRFRLLAACNRLRAALRPFYAVQVECKRLTATVHLRRVSHPQRAEIRDAVLAVLEGYPEFFVSASQAALDIRPRCPGDKGTAARWILSQLEGREDQALCIGDDASDERMFAALEAGITVRVGYAGETRARYRVEQSQVYGLLCWIRQILDARQAGR